MFTEAAWASKAPDKFGPTAALHAHHRRNASKESNKSLSNAADDTAAVLDEDEDDEDEDGMNDQHWCLPKS